MAPQKCFLACDHATSTRENETERKRLEMDSVIRDDKMIKSWKSLPIINIPIAERCSCIHALPTSAFVTSNNKLEFTHWTNLRSERVED
jgi:hypothetical protein